MEMWGSVYAPRIKEVKENWVMRYRSDKFQLGLRRFWSVCGFAGLDGACACLFCKLCINSSFLETRLVEGKFP